MQVSRSIGDALAARSVLPDPEIATFEIPKGTYTRFVAASDGLWDVYTSEAVGKMIYEIADPAVAARKLTLAAKAKRTQTGRTIDDITVVVFDLNPPPSRIRSLNSRQSSSEKCVVS